MTEPTVSEDSDDESGTLTKVLEVIADSSVTLLVHPFYFSRTMMMLGYEPLPAKLVSPTFWFLCAKKQYYMLPNIITYARALRHEIGLLNLFTVGCPALVIQNYLKQKVTDKVLSLRHEDVPTKKTFLVSNQGYKVCFREAFHLANARIAGVVLLHPLNVIMIRQMAEAIELRGASSSILSHMLRIISKEGLMSFFNGLGFRVLEEAITVYSLALLGYICFKYFGSEESDTSLYVAEYAPMITALCTSVYSNDLAVVATTMAVSGAGFSYLSSYSSAFQCFSSLSESGQLNRGTRIFFRYIADGPL